MNSPGTIAGSSRRASQTAILFELFRFRFLSPFLLAQLLPSGDVRSINRRLAALLESGYVGRRYTARDRLAGQSARYYLLPAGLAALAPNHTIDRSDARRIYKDPTASDGFVNHWLGVAALAADLSAEVEAQPQIFTASQLRPFEYFPKPLPDLYLRQMTTTGHQHTLVRLIDGTQPLWIYGRLARAYESYVASGQWRSDTGTEPPKLVLVSASEKVVARLSPELTIYPNCRVSTPDKVVSVLVA